MCLSLTDHVYAGVARSMAFDFFVTPPRHTRGSGRLAVVRKEVGVADRREGKGPYVRDEGGGAQPRSRNKDGSWRAKRSDAGQSRGAGSRKSGGKKR